MEPAQGGAEGNLENRLRSLILNNSSKDGLQNTGAPTPIVGDVGQHPGGPYNPEKLQGLHPGQPGSEDQPDKSNQGPQAKQGAPRKRLNQAQRRQMSAQLSIPIDTRPQQPQSARSYASPPEYSHQQYHQQSRSQRPHSATFRSPNHGHNIPNPPLTGHPFSSQARHQQSLSYHGPISPPRSGYDWRQHQSHHSGDGRAPHQAPQMDIGSPRNPRYSNGSLYQPNKQYQASPEELAAQSDLLERLCDSIIANAEIEPSDIMVKEDFRIKIQNACREAITRHEREQNGFVDFPAESVELKCFGSLSSGFATKAADMDLGLLSPFSHLQPDAPGSPIPRLVEKAFLDIGVGARLLTRTRVPIIKVCEKPPEHLRLDLLEERARWEKGTTDDLEGEESPDEASSPAEEAPPPLGSIGNGREAPAAVGKSSQWWLDGLREVKYKNLQNYYAAAKKRLRKAGKVDINNGNAAHFSDDESRWLNQFCLAFIDGLSDSELRQRLTKYRSLSRIELVGAVPHRRSLHGVFTQVEGEQMIMLAETRQVLEKDSYYEGLAQRQFRVWKDLQNKATFGTDPVGYNKELQMTVDQLRRIPSIQVLLLSQGQFESAAAYHARAAKILLDLGGHDIADSNSMNNLKLSLVLQQYISGVYREDMRQQIAKFAQSQQTSLNLRSVARKHKSLQLALEFEKAVERGLYAAGHVPVIKQYIHLLRSPLQKPQGEDSNFDLVVPIEGQATWILSEICQLPDPSRLAPNKPRDPYHDRLEFPKDGVGVQCDINFSAHLALQNTLLLRCYSHTDPRVRPMVLFIKHWAKVRDINTPYRGTLSSYGYVLMVLHYLVNIAQPFVCPNLQELAPQPSPGISREQFEETVQCRGYDVRFWRDEHEIQRLASQNALNQNTDSIGLLLRGFFEYYAQGQQMTTVQGCRGFDWGRDVLSIRTHGGLLSKQEKGWTGAKTIIEVKSMVTALPPNASPGFDHPAMSPPAAAQGGLQPVAPGQVTPESLTSPLHSASAGPQHGQAQTTGTTREVKEVRHRYLFAIEDPFELEHNVARTVTHNGIVAIRDEFRRAWRIIKGAGRPGGVQENLLENAVDADVKKDREAFAQLLRELHGRDV